jgi:hypothetical protein
MLMDRMSEPIASCRGVTPTERPSVTDAPDRPSREVDRATFAGAGASHRLWEHRDDHRLGDCAERKRHDGHSEVLDRLELQQETAGTALDGGAGLTSVCEAIQSARG